MKPKLTTILILTLSLFLSACVSPQPASTTTPLPSETPEPMATATATMTLTPSPTPLPPTPEYEGELTYDPDTQSLQNVEGKGVFQLEEDDEWVRIVPESIRDTVEHIEMGWDGNATWELVEYQGDEVYKVAVESGEWVYVRKDGSMFLTVGEESFEIEEVGIFEGESRAYYPGQQEDGQRWLSWETAINDWERAVFSGFNKEWQQEMVDEFLERTGYGSLKEAWEAMKEEMTARELRGLNYEFVFSSSEYTVVESMVFSGFWVGADELPLERGARYEARYGEDTGDEQKVVKQTQEGDVAVVGLFYSPLGDDKVPVVPGVSVEGEWKMINARFVNRIDDNYNSENHITTTQQELVAAMEEIIGAYNILVIPMDFTVSIDELNEDKLAGAGEEKLRTDRDFLAFMLDRSSYFYWLNRGVMGDDELGVESSEVLWQRINETRLSGEDYKKIRVVMELAEKVGGIGVWGKATQVKTFIVIE